MVGCGADIAAVTTIVHVSVLVDFTAVGGVTVAIQIASVTGCNATDIVGAATSGMIGDRAGIATAAAVVHIAGCVDFTAIAEQVVAVTVSLGTNSAALAVLADSNGVGHSCRARSVAGTTMVSIACKVIATSAAPGLAGRAAQTWRIRAKAGRWLLPALAI